ncbi:MAG TPA: potassium channel protein [Dehalococcoidales bacterium]|nr:potassium channel protein [Dehalococcoidales bacterium]
MNPSRRVLWGICALIAIVAFGVIGYMVIEGWAFLDALYMTVITITTVGYTEVHPLTSGGRIFSIFLIVGGVGGALYIITGIVRYVVEGNIGTIWERRRMKNKIANLKGHFILCGLGRVGEEIARTFEAEKVPFVIIENRPECLARLEQTDYIYLQGDATRDEVLKNAGIERARGLVAAVGSDTDNTYITLSARGLCPKLFIEARAVNKEAVKKLERAGANRIILPQAIGGRRMAMLALRPAVIDFIDTVIYSHGREMQLENVDIGEKSRLAGLTIKAARVKTGITILAVRKKKDDTLITNPSEEEIIEEGDQIIVIGTMNQLTSLEEAL